MYNPQPKGFSHPMNFMDNYVKSCLSRVCMCLEKPWNLWISGVWFQGLEALEIVFWSLKVPFLLNEIEKYHWQTLLRLKTKWKRANTCSGKQSITFSKCSWNVWKVVFHSQCTLLVTLTCMLSYGCTVHVWFSHFVKVLFSIVSVCVVGLRWRPQCQASVILMKNGWKKTSISQNWVVKVNYCKV